MTDPKSIADYKEKANQLLPRRIYSVGYGNEFISDLNCTAFKK